MNEVIEAYILLKCCRYGSEEELEKYMIKQFNLPEDYFEKIKDTVIKTVNKIGYKTSEEFSELLFLSYQTALRDLK